MLASAHSHAVLGMDACQVEVETDLGLGLPAFSIVGLPDAAVREAKERVRAGMTNSGFDFPLRRITVNLAPADVRKEGPSFDLPIALSLLAASDQLAISRLDNFSICGELSLDGAVRGITGALAVAEGARRAGRGLIVPAANAAEAALIDGLQVIGVANLGQAAAFLSGKVDIDPARIDTGALLCGGRKGAGEPDLADVRGQQHARRALEVCAAGGHNLLMIGPPGAGKTMLARTLPSILPPLSMREAIEVTRIYSVAGLLGHNGNGSKNGVPAATDPGSSPIITTRRFRAPHHSTSHAGLAGGSASPRPGEISLAHLGVLFLDELPEFSRLALESLRQPLEDGMITISRATGSVTFPARFMLVAAMNPCPCGHLGDSRQQCACPPQKVSAYRGRISGPLLDRIDIAVEVPSVTKKELMSKTPQEPSAVVASRVALARQLQHSRFEETGTHCNAQMSVKQLEEYCRLDAAATSLLETAIDRLGLSARAHHRILRVARTIADLERVARIHPAHLAEAISYRSIDRQAWHGR